MMRGQTLERGRHSPGHHAGSGDFASERLLSRAVPHPSASMHNICKPTDNRSRILQTNKRNFHHIFQKNKTFQPWSTCMDDHHFHSNGTISIGEYLRRKDVPYLQKQVVHDCRTQQSDIRSSSMATVRLLPASPTPEMPTTGSLVPTV